MALPEPKPFASLTSGLLARKGGARPAMRRQPLGSPTAAVSAGHDDLGWNDMGYDVDPANDRPVERTDLRAFMSPAHGTHEPMAEVAAIDADVASSLPAEPPVVVQQREAIAQRLSDGPVEGASTEAGAVADVAVTASARMIDVSKAPRPRRAAGHAGKAAFTLRLDATRHLRLRVASALTHRSSQAILTDLLDAYLATLPALDSVVGADAIRKDA